ncbi:MAG: penicillin-binding transpeptidase domain-containing protein [Roseibacillus sp.]|nr:penicillin-binding transpeptidase domain-containing protein [Roseibacillus sp.]
MKKRRIVLLLILLTPGGGSFGQDVRDSPLQGTEEGVAAGEEASVLTRPDARTMTLSIPGPRGLITDRNGRPLAENRVGYQLALQFAHFSDPGDEDILNWAKKRLSHASKIAEKKYVVSDEDLLSHYKDRRWLPLVFGASPVPPEKEKALNGQLMSGLIMHPVYLRHYPGGDSTAHVIGYVRSKGKLPTGPIVHGDLLFEDTRGDAGLERTMDEDLTGRAGERKLIFDSNGRKIRDELTERPGIGHTVVTTLNLDWQQHAEKVLKDSCQRGAFVVVDIPTGEVLVLASRPSYDINVWIPRISNEELGVLMDDESRPMFGRAFQGLYPPASSFKPVVALTALTQKVVEEWTEVDCPEFIEVGTIRPTKMWNWTKEPEGLMNVTRALARSNNCWFYLVGIDTGPSSFLSTARKLGYGSGSGLPLFGESSGRVPTNEYVLKKYGRPFTDGDTANYSIGQAWEATPLQVAQSMAGIANGSVLPKLQLIRQIQDPAGGVLEAADPQSRNSLDLDPDAVQIVHQGMYDVAHSSWGTGRRGGLTFAEVCAKTGTGQWIPALNQEVAWYAGFFPAENPRLAFTALYEGDPGEDISGGRKAAPMIPAFFEEFKEEIENMIRPPSKALVVVEEQEDPASPIPAAQPVDEEGNLIPLNGKILKAIPVEKWEEDGEPVDPVGEALPAIPVDGAPVAIPVEEDE